MQCSGGRSVKRGQPAVSYAAYLRLRQPPKQIPGMLQAGLSSKTKFSPPRIPLVISSQRVNIWYHTDPHDQWKRVTWPKRNHRPRAVISRRETRIDQGQAFLQFFSKIFTLFPGGAEKKKKRRILHDPVGRTARHACRFFFAQTIEGLTCLC